MGGPFSEVLLYMYTVCVHTRHYSELTFVLLTMPNLIGQTDMTLTVKIGQDHSSLI